MWVKNGKIKVKLKKGDCIMAALLYPIGFIVLILGLVSTLVASAKKRATKKYAMITLIGMVLIFAGLFITRIGR